ncbi:hypothetical protein SUNI508_11665 [Seiridium unicorne]|uniref:Uncharacterized protein n=1 Tax=Seiridium unicorne TaxID=138068 RepID=A0ABR2UGI0_9PEZI
MHVGAPIRDFEDDEHPYDWWLQERLLAPGTGYFTKDMGCLRWALRRYERSGILTKPQTCPNFVVRGIRARRSWLTISGYGTTLKSAYFSDAQDHTA